MKLGRSVFFVVIVFVISLSQLLTGAEPKSEGYLKWEEYINKLKKDPSLVRLYLFEEKYGLTLKNSAKSGKDGTGRLDIISESPYGQSREKRWYVWASYSKPNQAFPEWVEGRWPGKGAMASGLISRNVARSQFSGTKTGVFTFAAWVRMHGRSNSGKLFGVHTGEHPSLHKKSKNSGWDISYRKAGKAKVGKINFKMGVTTRYETITAEGFSPQVWHYLVCMWDGEHMKIYIDGKLVAEKACKGPYKHPVRSNIHGGSMPEYDLFGFDIGGKRGNERFDVDEIAIFDRALSAKEIEKNYEIGHPSEPLEQQLQRSKKQLSTREKLKSIKMDIPKNTYGIFRRGEKIPASITVPVSAGLKGEYTACYIVTDIRGQVVFDKKIKFQVGEKEAIAKTIFSTEKCGLYFFDMQLKNAKGKLIKRIPEEYGIAVTVPLPELKDIPLSSPLLAHSALTMPEKPLLGFRVDRVIHGASAPWDPWPAPDKFKPDTYKEKFDWIRKNNMKIFYCLHLGIKWAEKAPGKKYLLKDMNIWAEYCRKMYKAYGDIVYAWEIENEPNAGAANVPPDEYVEFLKVSYKTFKELDPNTIVVGGAGCPGFLNYYEKVYKAGGAKYFDVLSLHNYGSYPIKSYKEDRRIKRAITQLKKYRGEVVPVWNSESGFNNIARGPDNRPLSEDEMMREYPRTKKLKDGPAILHLYMPTLTEHARACWQIQAILLDLAAGCEKYTLLASSHTYSPAFNGSRWQPSELTPALAALASVLIPSTSVKEIPLSSSSDAGALITGKDKKNTAALFSDDQPTLSFQVDRSGTFKGMDMDGNPLIWNVGPDKILTAKLDSAPIYIFNVPVNFAQISFMRVVDAPSKLPENGILKGTLVVTNALKKPLNAQIIPLPPHNGELSVAEKVNLPSGKSKKLPFTLNGTKLKRRKYSLGFKLLADGSQLGKLNYYFKSDGVIQKVPEISDPKGKWWKNIAGETAEEEINVVHGKPVPGVPWSPQWRGKEDLSFITRLAWCDDGELLVRVDVTDNILMPAPEKERGRAFRYDCVELFFDGRSLARRTDLMSDGIEQILIVPNVTEKTEECHFWFGGGKRRKRTIEAKVVGAKCDNGYWVEVRIRPLKDSTFKVRSGSQFAFDILVDDTDSEKAKRKVGIVLHGEFSNASNPSKWGRYQLETGE